MSENSLQFQSYFTGFSVRKKKKTNGIFRPLHWKFSYFFYWKISVIWLKFQWIITDTPWNFTDWNITSSVSLIFSEISLIQIKSYFDILGMFEILRIVFKEWKGWFFRVSFVIQKNWYRLNKKSPNHQVPKDTKWHVHKSEAYFLFL